MLNAYIITSVVLAFSFTLLGLVVWTRNQKLRVNKLFLAFSISMSLWLVTNYLGSTHAISYQLALVSNRAVFCFSILALLALLAFVRAVGSLSPVSKIVISLNWLSILLALTTFVVTDIARQSETYAIQFGILAPIVFGVLILDMILIIYALLEARKNTSGMQREQVETIQTFIVITILGLGITNVILPAAFKVYSLTNAGAMFSSLIVVGLAYAIAKHRLFDIRLIIARALGYALSLALLAALFGFSVFGVAAIFFDQSFSTTFQIYVSLATGIIAISFATIKRFFDSLTSKLFFQDSYEAQDLLSELNKNVLTTVDVEPLLNVSTEIVKKYMKVSYCSVELRETSYSDQRILGDSLKFSENDTNTIRSLVAPMKMRVITTDDLRETDPGLYELLTKYEVAAVSKMASSMDYGLEGIGLIFFGIKKSGNAFNRQDKDIVGIISSELTIATQNALRFEEIENFNVTLQEKVDDATNRLKKANDKLKLMDETKDEFISMASHQLRTPLTSVKGYVSMVLEGDAGPLNEMQTKLLEQSFTSSQRMVYLIADLLNLSRLKTGKFVIEAKPTNLADVIQGEVEQLTDTATAKNLTLVYNRPKSFPELELDETKIRQVIMNFVDNAIYYTPSGGHIDIDLVETDKTIEFLVRDNGMGVPQAEQHRLFNKFFRAKNAQKARPDGTGLGLFMAKKVIVAQGGAIIFSSVVGKGSTFGFSFSKTKLQVETPSPIVAETSAPKA